VVLEVTDDGCGFVPDAAAAGLGLASMRDRAAAVGGTLLVRSAAGTGTRIRMSVPALLTPASGGPR
jgi:signal transduction histidine kinase